VLALPGTDAAFYFASWSAGEDCSRGSEKLEDDRLAGETFKSLVHPEAKVIEETV
jgi:hypothetical protein